MLSIYIPTYNNHLGVKHQLERIIPFLDDFEIIVVILDNYNEISVEDFISKFFVHDKIKYFRHSRNIGADQNIFFAYQNCQSDWLWVLSDNDLLLPNAVESVYQLIKKYYNCLGINFMNDSDLLTTKKEEFFNALNYGMSFAISYNLIHKKKLPSDFESIYIQFLHFSQAPASILISQQFNNFEPFYFSNYNPFLSSNQPSWSRKQFTILTYRCKKKYKAQFSQFKEFKKLEKSIFQMIKWNLVFGRVYQDILWYEFAFYFFKNLCLEYNVLSTFKDLKFFIMVLFFPKSKYVLNNYLFGEIPNGEKMQLFY